MCHVLYIHTAYLLSLYKVSKEIKLQKANIVLVSHFPLTFLFAFNVQDL